jgi:hypothetical protein
VSIRDFNFVPLLLTCSEEENIKRMDMDNRSTERKQRAIEKSRKAFDDIPYPQIDIADFSVSEAAENIIKKAGLSI